MSNDTTSDLKASSPSEGETVFPAFSVGLSVEGSDVVMALTIRMTREQWSALAAAAQPGSGFTRDFTQPNNEPLQSL